jgi:hypothetical protein
VNNSSGHTSILNGIFPLFVSPEGFPNRILEFLGTGFFVNTTGLALTAAHVLHEKDSALLRGALPSRSGPTMIGHRILWAAEFPGSDIAAIQLDTPTSICFNPQFEQVPPGQDVHTYAIPESLLEKLPDGMIAINSRVAKGYISHGTRKWVAASFPLPKGMSGAPIVVIENNLLRAAGVFAGQNRGEEIEDLVTNVTDEGPNGKHTLVEKTARIEYFARGELLSPYENYIAPEFSGLTLRQMTES